MKIVVGLLFAGICGCLVAMSFGQYEHEYYDDDSSEYGYVDDYIEQLEEIRNGTCHNSTIRLDCLDHAREGKLSELSSAGTCKKNADLDSVEYSHSCEVDSTSSHPDHCCCRYTTDTDWLVTLCCRQQPKDGSQKIFLCSDQYNMVDSEEIGSINTDFLSGSNSTGVALDAENVAFLAAVLQSVLTYL